MYVLAKISGYLIIWIAYFILSVILKWIENKDIDAVNNIAATNGDSNKTIRIRQRVRRRRWMLIILFWVVTASLLSTMLVITSEFGDSLEMITYGIIMFLMTIFYLVIVLSGNKKAESIIGNISLTKLEDVLSDKMPYDIYLRAFSMDCEETTLTGTIEKSERSGFSEYSFVAGLKKKGKRFYAVGRPSEIDSPFGADRVYLEAEIWKDGVLKLMEGAENIYIRVDAFENVIWELKQSFSLYPEKTIIIVTNLEVYNIVRQYKVRSLPEIAQNPEGDIYMLKWQTDSSWDIKCLRKIGKKYVAINGSNNHKLLIYFKKAISYTHAILSVLLIIIFLILSFKSDPTDINNPYKKWNPAEWAENIRKQCPVDNTSGIEITDCMLQDSILNISLNIKTSDKPLTLNAANDILDTLIQNNNDKRRYLFRTLTENRIILRFTIVYADKMILDTIEINDESTYTKLLQENISYEDTSEKLRKIATY